MKNFLCAVLVLFLCVSQAKAQTAIWASSDRSATTTSMRLPVDTSAVSTPGHLKVEPANTKGIYFNSGGHLFASSLSFDSAGTLFLAGAAQYCDENEANCFDPSAVGGALQNLVEDLSPQLGANLDLNTFEITGLVIGTDVQAFDAGLLSIAGLTTLADRMIFTTASDVYAVTTLTSAGRALIDDASTSAQRTTLALGTGDSPTFTGLTLSGLTTGSVVFAGASGVIAEDNANFFWDDANNRLGLGTITPEHALEVLGSTLETSRIKLTGITRAGGFAMLRTNGSEAVPTAVLNNNKLGLVLFQGHDGTVDTDSGARITAIATENWTATAHGAKMQFKTVDNTTTGVDVRMTIDQNGHIGIGTDSPDASALLDISTTTLGLLFPRLTTAQRDAIGSPVAGLTIYNTTTNTLNAFDSTWAGLLIDNIDVTVAQGGTGASDAATARTNLGLVIGTDVQAFDAVLEDLAALAVIADNEFIVGTGAGTYANESGATVRTSLGLVIGTDVQAFDTNLEDIAALAVVADNEVMIGTGAGTYAFESGATLRTSIGALANVLEDTTPQLGGDLDGQNNIFENVGAIRYQSSRNQPSCTTALEGTIFYNSALNNFNFCDDVGSVQIFSTGGAGLANIVEDTSPQLGAQLDVNAFGLGDGTLELLTFTEDGSAINHINIENEAIGSGPILSATGDDTNVDLNLNGQLTGNVLIRDGTDVTKQLSFEISGATTGTTTTLTASQTGNVIVTLPDATDTLVGKDTTDTLTTKSMAAGSNTFTGFVWDTNIFADGTDGQIPTFSATGEPAFVVTGTATQVLTSNGAGTAPTFQAAAGGGITLGTEQSTTSGTAFTFTGIPAGTKRVTMSLEGTSLNGTDNLLIQIGDSGGIETSAYLSTSSNMSGTVNSVTSTAGYIIRGAAAAQVIGGGTITLTLKDATNDTWIASGTFSRSDATATLVTAGSKSISAELTQIRLTRSGSNTFDGGSVNITFE